MVTGIDTGSPGSRREPRLQRPCVLRGERLGRIGWRVLRCARFAQDGDKIRLDFTRTYSDGSSKDFFADVTLR